VSADSTHPLNNIELSASIRGWNPRHAEACEAPGLMELGAFSDARQSIFF